MRQGLPETPGPPSLQTVSRGRLGDRALRVWTPTPPPASASPCRRLLIKLQAARGHRPPGLPTSVLGLCFPEDVAVLCLTFKEERDLEVTRSRAGPVGARGQRWQFRGGCGGGSGVGVSGAAVPGPACVGLTAVTRLSCALRAAGRPRACQRAVPTFRFGQLGAHDTTRERRWRGGERGDVSWGMPMREPADLQRSVGRETRTGTRG